MKNYNIPLRDGQFLHVREIGKGKPVLMLHGFAMQSLAWLPLVLPLANRYRFILPDLRGFGKSGEVTFNQNDVFKNYYEDIEDVLDFFKIDTIPLVGISMGAYMSLYYLSHEKKHRVEKFLCIDQVAFGQNTIEHQFGVGKHKHDDWTSQITFLINKNTQQQHIKDWNDLPKEDQQKFKYLLSDFMAATIPQSPLKKIIRYVVKNTAIEKLIIPTNSWQQWIQFVEVYLLSNRYNLIDKVAAINIPVTILAGLQNDMFPTLGFEHLHASIKDSKFVSFTKSGHALIYTEPLKFIKELDEFIKN